MHYASVGVRNKELFEFICLRKCLKGVAFFKKGIFPSSKKMLENRIEKSL